MKLRSGHRRCSEALVALRLLALSRFLLCERLQQVVERWIWRSGTVAKSAMAQQLLEGDKKDCDCNISCDILKDIIYCN